MSQKADKDGYFAKRWMTAKQFKIRKKHRNEARKRQRKKRDDLDFLASSRWIV